MATASPMTWNWNWKLVVLMTIDRMVTASLEDGENGRNCFGVIPAIVSSHSGWAA